MSLSEKAQRIFENKYAQTKSDGTKETWEEACWRVSYYVATAEKEYGATDQEVLEWARVYFQLIANKLFIPGGRILANAGTSIKNMFNCFVIPVEDSRESIYSALGKSAEIFAHGGGVGYNFSHIRERGADVKSTGGKASGPLSFMGLFDHTGEVISQASRRGAQMGILNIDHPDIEEFIDFKSTPNAQNERYIKEIFGAIANVIPQHESLHTFIEGKIKGVLTDNQLTHFNISVGISDAFMEAVIGDKDWHLRSVVPSKKGEDWSWRSTVKTVKARDLMRKIAESAWRSGDPGVIFLDRMEAGNMTPYLGKLEATNPCSEVTLLPNEPCCLGSINLSEMVEDGQLSEKKLAYVTTMATRFLDDVHTLNSTPIDEINEAAQRTRRLGLGVMGWADALVKTGLSYDSEEALVMAEEVMKSISVTAWGTSEYLAEERGTFPAFDSEKMTNTIPYAYETLPPLRNVAVTSIAPTGTIALICDVNSGIEPFFALSYKRYITEGVGNEAKDTLVEFNPYLKSYLEKTFKKYPYMVDEALEAVAHDGVINERVDNDRIFKTSSEIHWKDHINMQAAFQKYVDNSISKTINMPEDATVEDVMEAYIYAWQKGLKSIALYRDNSKGFQILNK